MKLVIFPTALFLLTLSGFSATITVPITFPTIQQAIDAAKDGDTILVLPGSYAENINFNGKAVIVRSDKGPRITCIDGMQSGSVVSFYNQEGPDSILDGFTITNGYGPFGGGIYCTEADPVIRNNVIRGNQVYFSGGGVFCKRGSPEIRHNLVLDNLTDGNGGGIYCVTQSSPRITSNVIAGNSAEMTGGGIHSYLDCSPILSNNTVFDNSADEGGGIFVGEGDNVITNNTIFNNTAVNEGGGMYCYLCVVTVTNTIFWSNDSPSGPEIWTGYGNLLNIDHSNVEGGMGAVYVEPGSTLNWGAGMISAVPCFVDPVQRDFHLFHNSPCWDSGDPKASGLPEYDFEGDPRIAGGGPDMGADEFHIHLYCTGDATPGGKVEAKLVGPPGIAPVGLWIGSGIMDPPLTSSFGDWYLLFPVKQLAPLPPIPVPWGVEILAGTVPTSPSGFYILAMQALIGEDLTNLFIMEIL